MSDSRPLDAAPGADADAPFSFSVLANRAKLAVMLGVLAVLLALSLTGASRAVAISGIVLVAWFVDVFRFEIRPRERTVTVRTLWWGLRERRSKTYSFDDVYSLRKATFCDGIPGYRWEFRDGTTHLLVAPIDARLIALFPARRNKAREAIECRRSRYMVRAGFLFWTAITVAFDVAAGWDAVRQVRARSYPHAVGHLEKNSVRYRDSGSDGSAMWNYEPDVAYSYVVDGITYRGRRYRYGTRRFSEEAARSLLPEGPEVTVAYNPRDPADAVLSPGLHGADVFEVLCLLPLNAVVAIGVVAFAQGWRFRATNGVAVWDDGRVVRAGVQRWSPAIAGMAAAGVAAFVLMFALGIPTGNNPSVPTAVVGWLIVLSAAGVAWRSSVRALAKGTRDLVIDRERQTLTLPVTQRRKEPLTVPCGSLWDIGVEDTLEDSELAHYAAVAVVTHTDGTTTHERMTDSQVESRANALAAWVRRLLPLHLPGGTGRVGARG